jgi:haloacetate dehalogenase
MSGLVFRGFESRTVATDVGDIFVHRGRLTGPALLLLHGFPETALMWRRVAALLSTDFSVVAADLPGYGASGCPADRQDHASMSKRAMAEILIEVMRQLGHERFAIVGHDRGGRVAYRAALDNPKVVTAVAVLDIVPGWEVWNRADSRLMLSFWPFSLFAQPQPLPERLILAAPDAVIDDALSNWGTPAPTFSPAVRRAYIDALSDPAHVHSICEEYRAAATLDRAHDEADLKAGRRIACPLLALWSGAGGLASWYAKDGGPLGLWRCWANDVRGRPVAGGHFFPEEHPRQTAELIRSFLLNDEIRTDAAKEMAK